MQHKVTEINTFIFWDKGFIHHCIMDNGESSKVTIQGIPQKLNSGGSTKNEQ